MLAPLFKTIFLFRTKLANATRQLELAVKYLSNSK